MSDRLTHRTDGSPPRTTTQGPVGRDFQVTGAEHRHSWRAAIDDITTSLLSGTDPAQVLRPLVRAARSLTRAAGAALTKPADDPDFLCMQVGEGTFTHCHGELVLRRESAAGAAIEARRALVIDDPATDRRTVASIGPRLIGQTVAAPMLAGDQVVGALLVAHAPSQNRFAAADVEMLADFAGRAAIAIQLAELRRDNERLIAAEDRHQIAVHLHHLVVQRLFRIGLSLQALAPRAADPELRSALDSKVREVDSVIHDLRGAVFRIDS